nr:autotransporter assembly complex family protein [Acinetobacter sp. HY1485]
MLLKKHFKKSTFVQSHVIYTGMVVSLFTPYAMAQVEPDSLQMLNEQQQNTKITAFQPIDLKELEESTTPVIDQALANEINQEAEQAKQQAQQKRQQPIDAQLPEKTIEAVEQPEPDINVDQLVNSIQQAHASDLNQAQQDNSQNNNAIFKDSTFDLTSDQEEPKGFFKRLVYRFKPKKDLTAIVMPKITTQVEGAPAELQTNIKNALATFTQEEFQDYSASLPQIKTLTTQAAQAVGYYDATFKFKKLDAKRLHIQVTANTPVKVNEQNIEFFGAGARSPQFQVIRLVPELDVGAILNHGLYEKTKTRISDAASDNGYFDAYWRLHDVKVQLPEDEANINLRYETGERYKLAAVQFKMSDASKPLPLRQKVLESMVPWKDGDDYTFWRVNTLANNLTNSRYFNWSLVDTVKPNPISAKLELPPDIQTLVDQQKLTEAEALTNVGDKKKTAQSSEEVTQNVVDEDQFAGSQDKRIDADTTDDQDNEHARLKAQARAEKKIPVIVTLNADKLNSSEVGIGYGTDTGVRLRTQYRRAIVNSLGHSFDANMEVSQIRQAIDAHYSIPYKNPLTNYFNLISGYEREKTDGVGPGTNLTTQSAILGADHIIRNPLGNWQHTYGVRYRLDKIDQTGDVSNVNVPDAFLRPGSNPQQTSLLVGYQLSRKDGNDPVNPVKGFKQEYKLQLGSKSALSDANMAIANINYGFIYSIGENYNHQFVGSAQFGYIFTDDFNNVPYNLRFFAGGDQSIRGFDYKALGPRENGYKIGGQALAVGSLEYNYQFHPGWRGAIFTDVGNAYDENFKTPTAYSVGLGVRWQSPIGPIRLDVASGISDEGHPIRLHFFIGSQL